MADTQSNDNTLPPLDEPERKLTEETQKEPTTRPRTKSAPPASSQHDQDIEVTTHIRSSSVPTFPSQFDLVMAAEENLDELETVKGLQTPKRLESPQELEISEDWETSGETGPWVVLFRDEEPGGTFFAANSRSCPAHGRFDNRHRHELDLAGYRPDSDIPKLKWKSHMRDRSTSAPMYPSSLRSVQNALPDWAAMTIYVPKSSSNWADDDENDGFYNFEPIGATSSATTNNNAEASIEQPNQQNDDPCVVDGSDRSRASTPASALSQAPSSISQSNTFDGSQENGDEASFNDNEQSSQNDEDSCRQGEDFTQDDDSSQGDADDLYQDDNQASHGDEESSENDHTDCSNCATLRAEIDDLQAELLSKDEEYSDLSDSFTRYGAETHQELEYARGMKSEIAKARSISRSTESFMRDIAYLATKATTVETENRKLKRDLRDNVTKMVERMTEQQVRDIAKYRAQRDEVYCRMKAAEAAAAEAEGQAQSERDKRLAVMLELQETLDMDAEMKEELMENDVEFKLLREENAEIKAERDQLKLDIDASNAKVAQLEGVVASTKQKEPPQVEVAREDAIRQSLDILEDMLAVVMRQQKLQKRKRLVLPTEEEERAHRARLVELGVYEY